MSWDWDTEDINPDKDNRKVWVPVTPKMLGEGADMGPHGVVWTGKSKELQEGQVWPVVLP